MRKKRQLDDPRALRDQASGAVIFAFGASGPEPRPLPGPALVAVLGALGMTEGTARAAILRMRRGGWLASRRRGPVVEYGLTEPARALATSITAPLMLSRAGWAGSYQGLLFSVPEPQRGYRDALRRAATLAGFGLLRPGLLIVVDPRRWSRIEPLLEQAPSSSRLLRVELRLALADARLAAAEAWPLASLATTYRGQAAELLQTVAPYRSSPPDGAAAVRLLWEAMSPISATAIEDPALPKELLPADWPDAEIQASVASAGMVLGPHVQAFIDAAVDGSVRPR
jgi:phenylacetic acid degradation operon negative regulatory protein